MGNEMTPEEMQAAAMELLQKKLAQRKLDQNRSTTEEAELLSDLKTADIQPEDLQLLPGQETYKEAHINIKKGQSNDDLDAAWLMFSWQHEDKIIKIKVKDYDQNDVAVLQQPDQPAHQRVVNSVKQYIIDYFARS